VITNEQVREALLKVIHPEIKKNLVELGMIRDVVVDSDRVKFTLVLPFMNVPIKDELIVGAKKAVEEISSGLPVEVNLAEMSQQERAAFMAASEGQPAKTGPVNRIKETIAVLSGKGGVGKSSVTALLAVALQRRGKKVGVLDADITGPSIPMMFGLDQHPVAGPLGILPVESKTGIRVMSINLLLPGNDQAVIWRGPLISSAIKQFWQDVAWGELDALIVDLPPGTSDASLTVMQSIPLNGIVLVTSPQDLAGMVVRKAANMAYQMKAPILGVVENMSYITCPHCGEKIEVFGPSRAQKTATQLGLPLIGQLPLDPELARRCDGGEIEDYAADRFLPIADAIADRVPLK
jgi:Mrp family chromosome partitioning ATPase